MTGRTYNPASVKWSCRQTLSRSPGGSGRPQVPLESDRGPETGTRWSPIVHADQADR